MRVAQIIKKCLGMALCLVAATTLAFGQATSQTVELKLNQPLEHELTRQQIQEYQVTLKAGEFMQVRVEQKGIDVVLSVHSASGRQLAEMDTPNGDEGFEILSFIAGKTGTYHVEIRPFVDVMDMMSDGISFAGDVNRTNSGLYVINLAEKRAATALDRKRIEAEKQLRIFFQGISKRRISDFSEVEEIQAEIKRHEELLSTWREFKDDYIIGWFERAINGLKELISIKEAKAKQKKEEEKLEAEKGSKRKAVVERRSLNADASSPRLIVPIGHAEGVESVAYSPDGKMLASGSRDNTVKLWDVASGRELKTFYGHTEEITSVAFSPDGKILASGSWDNTVKLWDIASGQELKTLTTHTDFVWSVAFSPDGTMLASSSRDETIRLWDMATKQELKTLKVQTDDDIRSVVFSPDGKTLAAGTGDMIERWDVATWKPLRTLKIVGDYINSIAFSPNGKIIATANENFLENHANVVRLWDLATGRNFRTLKGYANKLNSSTFEVKSVAFSPDGKTLASGTMDEIKLWDVRTGKESKSITGKFHYINSLAFSLDGKTLAAGSNWETVKLWDVETGQELKTFTGHTNNIHAYAFSSNGKVLATTIYDTTVKLWNLETGEHTSLAKNNEYSYSSVAFSEDGKALALGGHKYIQIVDLAAMQVVRTLTARDWEITLVKFSPDGRMLASVNGIGDSTVTLWDLTTGEKFKVLDGRGDFISAVAFSPDGKRLASASFDGRIKLWDWATGREIGDAKYFPYPHAVMFSPDGRTLVVASGRGVLKLWDITSGQEIKYDRLPEWAEKIFANVITTPSGKRVRTDKEDNRIVLRDVETEDDIATLIALDESDWAVVDADGRWDASDGAQDLMYYTLATPEGHEIIEFSQLKERYYEPDLLPKLLGYKKETIRDVAKFKDVLLPPVVEPLETNDARSTVQRVRIRNMNGGIGRVQVFVNGEEVIPDARDEELKANPNLKEYVLSFDLKDASVIPGEKANVRVVAWNYDENAKERYKGYISSRGARLTYLPPEGKIEPPTLYAIIGGISDYKGDALDLRYAAKDAEDMYQAIRVGGKNLFGAERVKLRLLSTSGNKDAIPPTKENFRKAFEDFSKEARPNDVLFVYLSGHGITLTAGSNTYYYLTQEAGTTEKEMLSKDSRLLESSTINSEELVQWHKSIKAQKRLLILDTCAAGAIGEGFSIVKKSELPSDAKRAIADMRDRVGFYVLMGSAADAVSYEASRYGQGLLTYSLLEGMTGPALTQEGLVDVSLLFNYAAGRVPSLAKDIGGIQRPEIRIPIGGTSFPFGLIKTIEDKNLIPRKQIKPIILRPSFQNEKLGYDNLKISSLLRDRLREAEYAALSNNTDAGLVFLNIDEMPKAIVPAGNYVLEGDAVKVTMNLLINDRPEATIPVEGNKNDLPALTEKIFEAIRAESQKLNAKIIKAMN